MRLGRNHGEVAEKLSVTFISEAFQEERGERKLKAPLTGEIRDYCFVFRKFSVNYRQNELSSLILSKIVNLFVKGKSISSTAT